MGRLDDDYDDYWQDFEGQHDLYRQATINAINGKKGQKLLKELEQALLALPEKRLVEGSFCDGKEVCASGALVRYRELSKGRSRDEVLAELAEKSASTNNELEGQEFAMRELGCVRSLAWSIVFANDQDEGRYTPEQRYEHVLSWVKENIKA